MPYSMHVILSEIVGPDRYDHPPADLQLQIEVAGEEFIFSGLGVHESISDTRDRLISDLADFVAESRFGWGQKRD